MSDYWLGNGILEKARANQLQKCVHPSKRVDVEDKSGLFSLSSINLLWSENIEQR